MAGSKHRMIYIFFILFYLGLFQAPQATVTERIPITLDRDRIEIDLFFHRETIKLYGTVQPTVSGVVAVLDSYNDLPGGDNKSSVPFVQRNRLIFLWIGGEKYQVSNIPKMYKLASSQPLNRLFENKKQWKQDFGYDTIKKEWDIDLKSEKDFTGENLDQIFTELIKWKERKGLYEIDEGGIQLKEDGQFLYSFNIPSSVEEGSYSVTVYAIDESEIAGVGRASFIIEQTGIPMFFSYLSAQHPVLYGTTAVILALLAGIVVSYIFKRRAGR